MISYNEILDELNGNEGKDTNEEVTMSNNQGNMHQEHDHDQEPMHQEQMHQEQNLPMMDVEYNFLKIILQQLKIC